VRSTDQIVAHFLARAPAPGFWIVGFWIAIRIAHLVAVWLHGASRSKRETLKIHGNIWCNQMQLERPLFESRSKPFLLYFQAGGGGRTRTYEGVSQRIYSPPPLPLGTLPHFGKSVT